jgi:putative ABC transport system permease protein
MVWATLKSLLSRKLRLVLSGLAVVLGVMFVSGAFVLTDTLGRSFDNLFATVYQNTDVEVRPVSKITGGSEDTELATEGIPADVVAKVAAVAGVESAKGLVVANGARMIGPNGKTVQTFGPPRLGENWTGESDLLHLREGRAPQNPNEIVINAALAKAAEKQVGQEAGVLTMQPKKTFTVVGIAEYSGGRDSLGGTMEIWFHESVASELMLGKAGVFSAIDVTAAPGTTPAQARDAVRAALGTGYDVKTGAELQAAQTKEFEEGLSFFNNILLGFAGVALFVGIFLILNTFSIIVAQRTRELALMRAIGASRRQMIGSVLTEAVIIGLVSSVIGLGLGIGAGALLAYVFGHIGGGDLELAGIGVPPAAVIAAFTVGMLVTVLAALLPALRASRIPPVAAMQEAATPDRPLTRITVAGALVGAAGGTLLALGLAGNLGDATLTGILGGVLISFIGVALLTPLISRPVVGVIGRLFSWSVPGKLGRRNSARNPRRTAITAAALMVGIALITGVNTILSSADKSLHALADKQVTADLFISGDQDSDMPPTFDPAVIDKAKAIPGVRSISAEYWDGGLINGKESGFTVVTDLPAMADMIGLHPAAGSLGTLGPDQVVVDEERARKDGLTVGSTVPAQFAKGGPHTLTVVGIYAKNEIFVGYLMSTSVVPDLHIPQPNMAYLKVTDGASVADVRKQVDLLLADSPEVSVSTTSEFIDQTAGSLDIVLRMVQILLALAVLIAVLGIVNTLALSVLERTRELGLVRAVGLSRAQSMRMVTVEAVVISVFGALLGVVVGTGLGTAVVRALKDEGITQLALPWSEMGTYLLLGAVIGVIAAVVPAIRAARTNVLQAIAYE